MTDKWKPIFDPDRSPVPLSTHVNPFMHHPAFGCEFVFKPLPLHMNQGALPFAEKIVLKGGEGE
jgi:hypothetical protein